MRVGVLGTTLSVTNGEEFATRRLGGFYYVYYSAENCVSLLFFSVKWRKRVVGQVEVYEVGLMWGGYELFEMFGMGLKYGITEEGYLCVIIGYSHVVVFEYEWGIVFRIKDKLLIFYGVIIECLRDARDKLIEITRIGKYKEKGVLPFRNPIKFRVRKEKRR
jgi:hypothetical protein